MNSLYTWPRVLLTFPQRERLAILMACYLGSMAIYMWLYPLTEHGYVAFLPIMLAAWLFRKRGLFVTLGAELLQLSIYQSVRLQTVHWPARFAGPFLAGFLVLCVIGLLIDGLRNALDQVEAARQHAEQLNHQLASSYTRERQLNELKTQFILNINHELRTPLTVVSGYLEILQLILRQNGHLDRQTHEKYLEQAIGGYQTLETTINSILGARTFGPQEELHAFGEVPLTQTIREVLDDFDDATRSSHPIQLAIPCQLRVWADKLSLLQVLHNLLSNAFKYSPAHTPIEVRATLDREQMQQSDTPLWICISVSDSGPGIPSEEIPLLFQPFVRLKRDLGGPVRGTGLGLYLCKTMVELMGGRIWVESAGVSGQGSRFCFTLPTEQWQLNSARSLP